MIALATVLGISTIALFVVGAEGPQGPDTHLITAYWYKGELDKLNHLIAQWDSVTKAILNNYLENHGAMAYSLSPDTNLNDIEANIKGMVLTDFGIELDLKQHPRYTANIFYGAPNVNKITKDTDKQEYSRLYDQYDHTKYTLNQVVSAYNFQILTQEDYIIKHIQKPDNCHYQKESGNFDCR
jgi:hypothetical protein